MKTCKQCGETKPADAEHFTERKGGRLRSACRACTNVSSRESHRRRREARASGEGPKPRPKPAKKPKPAAEPKPARKVEPLSPKPEPRQAKDCRYSAAACRCDTHLPAGYWTRLERNARRFADELERLDETDPAEARRREAELLDRLTGMSGTLR